MDIIESQRREAEAEYQRWKDATLADRAEGLRLACEAAMQILNSRPDKEAVLAWQEPISEKDRAWNEQLKEQYRNERQKQHST